jgi:glycosyltransferase involved in cell wall biosynthesis
VREVEQVNNSSKSQAAGSLHVLTLTPFYPTREDDASGCFVAEPLHSLAKTGIRHTVFAAQPIYRGSFQNADSAMPVQWVRYLSLPGGFGLPSAGAFLFARIVGKLRELHRVRPIDLIHAHGPLPCGHAAMLISEELRIPFVVSVHGLDAFSDVQVSGRAGAWCRRISQRTYRASRRVICISEHVREQVLEGLGRACRTSVVYNGVDPELFSPAAESLPARPVILSVGNLIPIKGHDVLIRALAAIAADFPEISLEVIGDGAERARLQTLSEQLEIAEKVRFLGRRSRHEVAEAMRRCMLFALPSRYEGLGCVYLEAMCVGKPVIGCRGQGIAEIIRHGSNGFLVGPDNEKELAIALAMLLRDEQKRNNLGMAARDTILERLTLEHQAENLLRIYRECARRGVA